MPRSLRRSEVNALARALALRERHPSRIVATLLRERAGLNARVAARLAHGWTQADVADEWNRRWPDEPKSFKSVSYWENWPGRTGHTPSLVVLDRLARIYRCDVADLLADWGNHADPEQPGPEPTTTGGWDALAWQTQHLDLVELTRSMSDWSDRLPAPDRRALLLTLSTAVALAAAELDTFRDDETTPTLSHLGALAGRWQSRYRYRSSSRAAEFVGLHDVILSARDGRLIGRSLPQESGSEMGLSLSLTGNVATGSWTERTSPTGHYRAATYRGTLQLVIDPTGRSMSGQWLGVGKRFVVNTGSWDLIWDGPAEEDPPGR